METKVEEKLGSIDIGPDREWAHLFMKDEWPKAICGYISKYPTPTLAGPEHRHCPDCLRIANELFK